MSIRITFANALLQQPFPSIGGFQSILLSQNNGFHPVKSECNSIQIHHTGQFHWLTSASFDGNIYLYYSKFSGRDLSSSLQVQLALRVLYIRLVLLRKMVRS